VRLLATKCRPGVCDVICCYTERFADGEAAASTEPHNNDSVSSNTFLHTAVIIIVLIACLTSLVLFAIAVHLRRRGDVLQPLCNQTTKVEAGRTATVVVSGQTLECVGLLTPSSYGHANKNSKPPSSSPARARLDSEHHPSTARGSKHLSVPPYRRPIWALPPPPPPPPSSAVDDAFSEFTSTFAVFPSTDNDNTDHDDDHDDDDDDDELRTLGQPHHSTDII